jgi:hypothetical protein
MQVAIKKVDHDIAGASLERQLLATLNFETHEVDSLTSLQLAPSVVELNNGGRLLIEGAYTPNNCVLSILMDFQVGTDKMRVFSVVCELAHVPTSFTVRLPTKQTIELYL